MALVHLLVGVLAGLVAGAWGWVAGQPVWVAFCLYFFGGNLGIAASALAHFLQSRRATAARKADGVPRLPPAPEECPTCAEEAIRVSAADERRDTSRQYPPDR